MILHTNIGKANFNSQIALNQLISQLTYLLF